MLVRDFTYSAIHTTEQSFFLVYGMRLNMKLDIHSVLQITA